MKKLLKSFKSNTRVYDDNSIEVTPQAEGTPSQRDVKKVGRSKRYATTGKNPLTCVELKCPEEVTDKAALLCYVRMLSQAHKSGDASGRGATTVGRLVRRAEELLLRVESLSI